MTAMIQRIVVIDQLGDELGCVEHATRILYGASHGVIDHELAPLVRSHIVHTLDARTPLGILEGRMGEVYAHI